MDICVIGGGAAGLVSAIVAAKSKNNRVRILELRDRVGKKILATGNGKCNMTNSDMSLIHYHGLNDDLSENLVNNVFKVCSSEETNRFFEELGIVITYKKGYAYPLSEQASAVLDVLRFKLESLGVEIICDSAVTKIEKKDEKFIITSKKGKFNADTIILSCGSYASIGDDNALGYDLARSLGHHIVKPLPALVPIICSDKIFKSLSGIRTKGSVCIIDEKGKELARSSGEIQLASYGISGIPAFMVSHVISRNIDDNNKNLNAILDFLPEKTMDELIDLLKKRVMDCPYKSAENFLIGLLSKNLALSIIKLCEIDMRCNVGSFTDKMIEAIAGKIKGFKATVIGTKSYKEAQICSGGIDISEIESNLESKLVRGLYFAGEMIDVHGDCGGYNLQWAFSSGMRCALNCLD